MNNNKYILAAWIQYKAMCVPKTAGALQVKETRQAFYSGAAVLFTIITEKEFLDGMEIGDIEPTDNDLERMNMLFEEINEFGASLDKAAGIRRH